VIFIKNNVSSNIAANLDFILGLYIAAALFFGSKICAELFPDETEIHVFVILKFITTTLPARRNES